MDPRKIKKRREQLKKRIGDRVRLAREEAGFPSQDALAEAVGISRQAISAIERGKSVPSSDTLFLIAEETGKSLDFFFPALDVRLGAVERVELKLDQVLELLTTAVGSGGLIR